jgi:cytochrome P450
MNDGAAHAPLKAIVLRQMAALDLNDVRVRAQTLAAALPRVERDDSHEANRWMFTLPVLTVADLLGLPLERDTDGHVSTRVAGFVATFATAMSPLASPADVEAGVAAARWLTQWAGDHATDCEGLLQRLAQAAGEADIDPAALTANAIGLMIQACEATAGLIGNTLLYLGRSGSRDADIDASVDLVARVDPPVQNTRRFMAADTTLCGQTVRAGDAVLVLLAAAAHDATAAVQARPWTFGAGRHGCPGDALARVLASCTVQALLARDVRPDRLHANVSYRPSVNARIPNFQPNH